MRFFQQEEDPNAAPECDLKKCKLPECFCHERHDDEFVVNPFAGKLTMDQVILDLVTLMLYLVKGDLSIGMHINAFFLLPNM